MKRPTYVPQYTSTERRRPLYSSPSVSPTSDIHSIDENNEHENSFDQYDIQQEKNSHATEIPSTSQYVGVKTSSSLKFQICLIIFGSIILLAAIAAIVTSVLLNTNQTTSNSSNSSTTTLATTTGVTTTTTTALYSCSNFTVTMSWNYPNNDIASALPMSFGLCCLWCLGTSSCTTFVLTTSSSTCWIKTSTGGGGSSSSTSIGAAR